MAAKKLTDEVRAFIVQRLATFDTPSEVAHAVKDEFGIEITKQGVYAYHPGRAGTELAKKWVELFHATRKAFIEQGAEIGVRYQNVRINMLGRAAKKAEAAKNFALMGQLLEQVAKETANAYQPRGWKGDDSVPILEAKPREAPPESIQAIVERFSSASRAFLPTPTSKPGT